MAAKSTTGCNAGLAMSHGDTGGEPGIDGIAIVPKGWDDTGTPAIPACMTTG